MVALKIFNLKILFFISAIIPAIESFTQSFNYYRENLNRIDEYINGPLKLYSCEEGMTFPNTYNGSKIRSDLRMITFVNTLFNDRTTKADVDNGIIRIRKKAVPIVKSFNGLIESYDFTVLGKYLWINVKLDFIDSVLVRSKVTLRTTTQGKCGSHDHLLDFKVVRDFFIREANMVYTVGYDEMTSDTIYSTNLVSLAQKRIAYKFNIPGSNVESWINEIFIKQYQVDSADVYNYMKAPSSFVMLIKENKTDIIKDLLFSPNYVTSLNAMEALLFLASTRQVQLSSELIDRITQIKNGSSLIMQQGAPDVYYKRKGYKDLQMTDERVIKKYNLSM